MKKQNKFSVTFFVKKTKALKDGTVPIYIRLSNNGERTEFSSKQSVPKALWDSKKTIVKGTTLESRKINNQLTKIREKLNSLFEKQYVNEEIIDIGYIKESFLGLNEDKKFIVKMYDLFINDIKSKIGIEYKPKTCVRHINTKNILLEYIKTVYKKEDVCIDDINFDFINGFHNFMITKKKHNPNTRGKNLKNFKIITTKACKMGLMKIDPFCTFKIPSNEVDKEPLCMSELQIIKEKIFNNERIETVRDLFVFCCYTGLAYTDLCSLRNENIKYYDGNRKYIEIYRNKSKIPCYIPIFKPVEEIIEKYKEHPLVELKQTIIPIYSNQKLNSYLKEIADLCNIQKPITTHIGRYTFNTTIAMENGINSDARQKILGHTNQKMNDHYSKVQVGFVMNVTDALYKKIK